jgi:hypothetical protein
MPAEWNPGVGQGGGVDGAAPGESELEFLHRRAREERASAESAPDPPGYRRHTDLARLFECRIRLAARNS